MATFKHGLYVSEQATRIQSPVEATAALPFFIGTAPQGDTNVPKIFYTFAEAEAVFGYEEPVEDDKSGLKKHQYSIHEFMYSQFKLYGVKPVVIVSVGTTATADAVIGGSDTEGNKTGLELVDECFPRFRKSPGLIVAPDVSGELTVAATMAAKAALVGAKALIDIPTGSVTQYTAVSTWMTTNKITDKNQIACFPMVEYGGVLFHFSVQLAGLIGKNDAANDDVPYVSPSNKAMMITSAVLESGKEVYLTQDAANVLNENGVVTAFNTVDGFVCWGNNTACYPANKDVKDYFIPVSRMFAWVGNTLNQNYFSKLDMPITRRNIDTMLDNVNLWLNGMTAKQYILGGRVEFNEDENPTENLMAGKAIFHVFLTPPSPMQEMHYVLEYDSSYVSELFK